MVDNKGKTTLSQQVYEALTKEITLGRYLPGDAAVGNYFAPYLRGRSNDGDVVLGSARLERLP